MTTSDNWLYEEYTIDTPENVSFGYEVAGIGSRFIGGLIDGFILAITLFFFNIILMAIFEALQNSPAAEAVVGDGSNIGWTAGVILAIYALLNFIIVWGYFLLFELVWNGQSPGKRWVKIRVVRVNGSPAGFLDLVVRNLVRMVDMQPLFFYGVGLGAMFLNHHARRLGDFAAGTIVVKERANVTLESLGESPGRSHFTPTAEMQAAWQQRFPGLRQLSGVDYELIREALRRHDRGQISPMALNRLATALASKLNAPIPPDNWQDSRRFLADAAEAYRSVGS
ncbi:MAG: RDD family protein [Caldilineaceae bacterium]